MGIYFNPDNVSFRQTVGSPIYVDKTGLISVLNKRLCSESKCIALSHARRFGKSQAAGMIDAYYSCGSDSKKLFAGFKIASCSDFETHLNKYNVIHLDISSFTDWYRDDLVDKLVETLNREFKNVYPDLDYLRKINEILMDIYAISGKPFVIIIDEWDCVVRNFSDAPEVVRRYLQFLHSLFKSEESKSFLALAYITGILPIKKVKNESALNNFTEYTMIDSKALTPYFGFTEDEVKELCAKYCMDFESVSGWYNGYKIRGQHMYNPYSVYHALEDQSLESYWKNTSSFETLSDYITLNFDGLKDDIITMLDGGMIRVNVDTFQNDTSIIKSKDDVLTALIHLGYLAYDADCKKAYIPNYEVSIAYQAALASCGWTDIAKSISLCEELLDETIAGNEERVAEIIELAHETYSSLIAYNDENSLSCTINMAYYTARAYYTVIREFPSGRGFADYAFIPRREAGSRPAMIIELKWDKTADSAIRQIKEKRYSGSLSGYDKGILLVGINYDKELKKHSCKIEKL